MSNRKVTLPAGHRVDSLVYTGANTWLARVVGELTDHIPSTNIHYFAQFNATTGVWSRVTDYPDIQTSYGKIASNGLDAVYAVNGTDTRFLPSLNSPYMFDYSVNALALSTDELWLYVGTTSGLFVYTRDTLTSAWTVTATLRSGENVEAVDVNPANTHVAVGLTANNRVQVFKRVGEQFSSLLATSSVSCRAVKYSPNGVYLAIGRDGAPRLTFYKVTGDTYTPLSFASTAPTGTVYGIAWSPSNDYLAVAHFQFPRVSLYSRSVDTFTKIANPATTPTSTAYSVDFAPDDTSLLVGARSTPFVWRYDHSAGTFTRNATIPTTTAADTRAIKFARDGSQVYIGTRQAAGDNIAATKIRVWDYAAGVYSAGTNTVFAPYQLYFHALAVGTSDVFAGSLDYPLNISFQTGVTQYKKIAQPAQGVYRSDDKGATWTFLYDFEDATAKGAGKIIGAGALSGLGAVVRNGVGTITESGSITGTGDTPYTGVASSGTGKIIGSGELSGLGAAVRNGTGTITGSGVLTGKGDTVFLLAYWYTNDQPLTAYGDVVFCGMTIDMQADTTYGGAVYKSVNRGATWTRVYDTSTDYPDEGQDGCDLTAIQAKPNGHVVTTVQTYDGSSADFAITSLDAGATWGEFKILPSAPVWVSSIGYTDTVWYTSGEGYIRRSIDNGDSWARILIDDVSTHVRSVSYGHPTIAALANTDDTDTTKSGVLISDDNAATWENSYITYPVVDRLLTNVSGSTAVNSGTIQYGGDYWAYAANNEIYFRKYIEGIAPPQDIDVTAEITADTLITLYYGLSASDTIRVKDSTLTDFEQALEVTSGSTAVAQIVGALVVTQTDALDIADTPDFNYTLKLLEALRIATETQTFYSAALSVTDTLNSIITTQQADASVIEIAIEVEAVFATQLTRIAQVLDELDSVTETASLLKLGIMVLDEHETADSTEVLGTYQAMLSDDVGAHIFLRFGDEQYTGWVMNTEGDKPLSEYTNFNFNSFCRVGDTYYAAADEGIYTLGGDTDASAQIDAALTTMMLDFGSPAMKRVQAAYIGYTASGKLLLKVRSVTEGTLKEQWYEAKDLPAQAPREQMVRLGRGMRSRYWQFELVNVDGADFEVNTLELHPVYLNRRV